MAYERSDYETGLSLAQPAAGQGNAAAWNWLGMLLDMLYQNGRGVTQDNAQAVRWYRKAAAQGDADAQTNLDLLSAKEKR